MKRIVGLREIADQFDLFLVDQYGVLHDGVVAYPGAVDGLVKIAAGGRKASRRGCRTLRASVLLAQRPVLGRARELPAVS